MDDEAAAYRFAPLVAVLSIVLLAVVYNLFLASPLGLTVYMNNTHIVYACEHCNVTRIILTIGSYHRVLVDNETEPPATAAAAAVPAATRASAVSYSFTSYGDARIVLDLGNSSGTVSVSEYLSRLYGFPEGLANRVLSYAVVREVQYARDGERGRLLLAVPPGEEARVDKAPTADALTVFVSMMIMLLPTGILYTSRYAPGAGYLATLLVPVYAVFLLPVLAPSQALPLVALASASTAAAVAAVLRRLQR